MSVVLALGGCTTDNLVSRYLLAERLWTEGKYPAAVQEFDRVTQMDPRGKTGLQALLRSANTQNLFLKNYPEALKKYENYLERAPQSPFAWETKKQIGEILYQKLEKYDQALALYDEMLKSAPNPEEAAGIHFRIAKSLFYLWRFPEAVSEFKGITKKFPQTHWADQAQYEWGMALYTQAAKMSAQEANRLYAQGIQVFRELAQKKGVKLELVVLAQFAEASCLEEVGQLEEASTKYRAILTSYPTPSVVQIKLNRLKVRMKQSSTSGEVKQ